MGLHFSKISIIHMRYNFFLQDYRLLESLSMQRDCGHIELVCVELL